MGRMQFKVWRIRAGAGLQRPVQDSAVWYRRKYKLVVLPLVVAQNMCLVDIILLVAEITPDN